MKEVKPKICANGACNRTFKPYTSIQKCCSQICDTKYRSDKKSQKYERKKAVDGLVDELLKNVPKRKPIAKFSEKRTKQNKTYSKLRIEYLTENPICDANLECCTIDATTIHHQRGRIGELLTNTEYFLGLCMPCHEYIELHPEFAKEKGFSLNRLSDEKIG